MQLVELTRVYIERGGNERTKPIALLPTAIISVAPRVEGREAVVTVNGHTDITVNGVAVREPYRDVIDKVNRALETAALVPDEYRNAISSIRAAQ